MKPAVTDPFPAAIEIRRQRRRSIELSLEEGRLVARVPRTLPRAELEDALPDLRRRLWRDLRRNRIFDDAALQERAEELAATLLRDLHLPAFEARFSRRQHRRWGSCTLDRDSGVVRISARLAGHPRWVIDHLLVHELLHLLLPNHGPRFQELLRRCPHAERAEGYLEALEIVDQLGRLAPRPRVEIVPLARRSDAPAGPARCGTLPLFGPQAPPPDRSSLSSR